MQRRETNHFLQSMNWDTAQHYARSSALVEKPRDLLIYYCLDVRKIHEKTVAL